jgi:2-polyprenyl-6-hydroxyphenyl methylase / 3-demethylubiquinone-9 3-methyltransferase
MMNKNTTIDTQEVAKFSKLSSEWWNKDGPLKTLHDINPARLQFVKNTTQLTGLSVLDVGCGGGILSESMAKLGAEVTALDADHESIKVASFHAKENNITVKYECTPIEDLENNPFDIVVCMEMLEHVKHPQQVIDHCARLLKPGGYLFLSTINRTFAAYAGAILAAEYVLGIVPKQTHDYDKFIKPSELAACVRQAGIDVLTMKGMSYNPLNRTASLVDSVQVNYLMACQKPMPI